MRATVHSIAWMERIAKENTMPHITLCPECREAYDPRTETHDCDLTREYDDPGPTPEEEEECFEMVAIGIEDSASCDLPATPRHSTHEGPCSLGGRASWSGGGSCAGDPLPVRNLKLIPEPL